MRFAVTVMAVVVFAANLAYAADEKKKIPDGLPGDAKWDLSDLEKNCVIIKATYDSDERKVVWVLEAKHDVGRFATCFFKFLDADDVQIARALITFEPEAGNMKGAHLRAILKLPEEKIMKEAKKVNSTDKP